MFFYLVFLNIYYWEKQTFSKLVRKVNFLRKWVWFQGHNERFPKYLGEKLKFQKTKTRFCRWKSTDNNYINIFLPLENPFTFLFAKENTWRRIFNTNSELSQNRTDKEIMLFKTTRSWLLNDIWCYLVIGFLIEKLAFFNIHL